METIDVTPTWAAAMPILIECLENGTEVGKRSAREELMRVAAILDHMIEERKQLEDDNHG